MTHETRVGPQLTEQFSHVLMKAILSKAEVQYDSEDGFYIALETDPDETLEFVTEIIVREIAHVVAAHRPSSSQDGAFYDGARSMADAVLNRLCEPVSDARPSRQAEQYEPAP